MESCKKLPRSPGRAPDLDVVAAATHGGTPFLDEPPERATPAQEVGDVLYVRIGSRLSDVERWLIEATLQRVAGNKRRAADVLGCSVKTLYNKLNRYARPAGET